MLAHSVARRALSPCWRVGPAYADDVGIETLRRAARLAGWSVLVRPLGRSFALALGCDAWPRMGTRRRLAQYRRRLDEYGPVRFVTVSGADWSDATIEELATVEAASWMGLRTDGSGPKFLTEQKRAHWRQVLADPVIGAALSATILRAGEAPVAFSFDLRDGERQYAIACSYDQAFAAFRPGKLVTEHQFARAAAAGVETVDLGTGDGGYKREMGARPDAEIVDLLFVRSRSAAALLSLRWKDRAARRWREPLLATGALAAATLAAALGG